MTPIESWPILYIDIADHEVANILIRALMSPFRLFYLFNVARLRLSMYLGKRSRYIRSVSTIPKCPVVSRDEDTKADGWWTLKIGKDDGAIQERFPWCPAPELFWTFHKYIRTIETFATEKNPAQVYPMFRWREYLAEITDP